MAGFFDGVTGVLKEVSKRIDVQVAADKKAKGKKRTKTQKLQDTVEEAAALDKEIADTTEAIRTAQENFEKDSLGDIDSGIGYLKHLIQTIGSGFMTSRRKDGESFGNLNSSINLMEMLADKKAVFTNGSLPGTYRYYSASHPKKEHQGQLEPNIDQREEAQAASVTYKNPFLEAVWKDEKVLGFAPQPTARPNERLPDAQLIEMSPEWGIKVLTNNPEFPGGETVPTSEIRELMFSVCEVSLTKPATATKAQKKTTDVTSAFKQAMAAHFKKSVKGDTHTLTFEVLLTPLMQEFQAKCAKAVEKSKALSVSSVRQKIGEFPAFVLPETLGVRDIFFSVDTTGDAAFAEVSAAVPALSFTDFFDKVVESFADMMFLQFRISRRLWKDKLEAASLSSDKALDVWGFFTDSIKNAYGSVARVKQKGKKRGNYRWKSKVNTPVFPVSDEGGYEVIGAYSYGRGVDIDPEGVFGVLHAQDPLALLDRYMVDRIVRAFIRRKPVTIERQVPQYADDKTTITGYTTETFTSAGPRAKTALEQEVLKMLRTRLTDQQILDVGLAVRNKDDATILDFDLNNWIAEKSRDGIQKVPLNNAAYSLADMQVNLPANICNCKMAEANVLLDVAGQEDFVQFAAPGTTLAPSYGDGTQDRLTEWLMATAAQKAVGWQFSQDAIRGTVADRGESPLAGAIESLPDALAAAERERQYHLDQLVQKGKTVGDIGEELGSDFLDIFRNDDEDADG